MNTTISSAPVGTHYGASFYDICTTLWLNFDDTPESLRFDRKRRMGRGALVSVDGWTDRSESAELDPESSFGTDQILSELAFKSANSAIASHIQREQKEAVDLVEHVDRLITPANREVLRRVLQADEAGESYREAGLHQEQVRRAKQAGREAIENQARRTKRTPVTRTSFNKYNPSTVPMELIVQTHKGATMPIIGAGRSNSIVNPRILKTIPSIHDLKRPRTAQSIKHVTFGEGVVLRERLIDAGTCLDVEFTGNVRRTILAEFAVPC